jgi:diadenosine tetraphosphate (Ap4A) HIT family hydrolase/NTP pyrophosphatase (non-canonical NTP hydrolase)
MSEYRSEHRTPDTVAMDHRLESDSTYITDLPLCQVRLHHNAAFPWIILIPHQENLVEIIDLSPSDQILMMGEISLASQVMKQLFKPHKLNVANLGNVVPQLHVHVVARYETDEAWPGPIWNSGFNEAYDSTIKSNLIKNLQKTFENLKSQVANSFLSPLRKASIVFQEASSEGFDWAHPFQAASKVQEELEEVMEELKKTGSASCQLALKEEMGDLLLASVILAHHAKVDPEEALFEGSQKFARRYNHLKSHAEKEGISLQKASKEELSALWRELKKVEG